MHILSGQLKETKKGKKSVKLVGQGKLASPPILGHHVQILWHQAILKRTPISLLEWALGLNERGRKIKRFSLEILKREKLFEGISGQVIGMKYKWAPKAE